MTLAIREPNSLVAVNDQCEQIEAWAETCESVPELRDAINRCAAIDEYLARTSTEGRARVAAAIRRLEARVGVLTREDRLARDQDGRFRPQDDGLSDKQRHEFRLMAEHPEVVEEVIAESTDQSPASRRKVMQRIADAKKKHPVEPVPFKSRAAVEARVAKAREMAAEGFTSRQIADAIGITAESMAEFRSRHGIEVHADKVVGKARRLDSNRIVNETIDALAGLAMGVDLIVAEDLDRAQVAAWATSLSDSLRSLNRLSKQLKEMAQ